MEEARRTGGEEISTEPCRIGRRIVHLEVAESPGMETVTIGDGYFKRVDPQATPKSESSGAGDGGKRYDRRARVRRPANRPVAVTRLSGPDAIATRVESSFAAGSLAGR